jgi:hypothetical protein
MKFTSDNFPSGIAKINITWLNYYKNFTKEIEIYAGFFAIKQHKDKTLEPVISWAVCDSSAKTSNHELAKNYDIEMKHKRDYWSPHICKTPVDSAVYDIKQFKTYGKSIAFIKALLIDSVSKTYAFNTMSLTNDTLEFVVFSNGKLGEFALKGKNNNQALLEDLKNKLLGLPEKWFPALAHPQDVLMTMGMYPEDNKLKVRANSLITIPLVGN